MRVFWAKGYDAVTIDDLVDGMGVGRPSLYAVFGDKAALFKRSLETYAEEQGAGAIKALQSPDGVRDSIAAFIVYAVKSSTTKGSPRGCLLGCVAPVVNDPDVRDFLVRANAQTVFVVEQRLRRAIDAGQLASDFPVAVRARQVIDLTTGLATRARLGAPRAQLLTDAEQAATLVLGSDVTSVGRSPDDAGRRVRRVRR